jgi:multidrug efflux system outer membrane protein
MKLKIIPILCIVMASIMLVGCMTVGPNFSPPDVQTPPAYRYGVVSDESLIDIKWWELFNDPVLYQLVSSALENNRNLKMAVSRIEQARAALGVSRADQYPRVDIQAGAATGNFSGSSLAGDTNTNLYIAPALSWEIDFWGKFRRATEAARAELVASEYGLKTVQLGLVSEVAGAYYILLDYHQRLQVAQKTLASREESLDIIQQRFDEGIIPELDLNQAQIQKEIAAGAIPLYERQIALTENVLNLLMGRLPTNIQPQAGLMAQTVPPAIPTGLPSAILERRPDIVQAMYAVHAQTARIGQAEALRFPAITLTGALGLASTELGSITTDGGAWSVGGSLLGPIFDYDKNLRRVEIERQKTEQTVYAYENTVLTAFREVEDALVEIETYQRQIQSVTRKLKAAANANKLAKDRYDQGVSNYLEVLDSERTLFTVELEMSELKQLFLTAYVRLYKALGGGWISPDPSGAVPVNS